MAKVRCKKTDMDSFFGNFLHEQKVGKDHFLRKPLLFILFPRSCQ
ncbi:MAG: hypothetical protein Q8O16_05835 [Dehalococcoidia bacterium]|nr:hypothetical protein [Dehalococcoidia bacterium]